MSEQAEPLLRPQEQAALDETRAMLQAIRRDLIRFVVRLLPAIVRVVCIGIEAGGLVYGVLDAWAVFGSDGAALIPALLLGVIPLLFAFLSGVKWGGLVASGAFTYGAAQALKLIPFPFNQVFLIIVLAALIVSDMARRNAGHEANEYTKQ